MKPIFLKIKLVQRKDIQYNSNQDFCVDCERPINKNCKKSEKMNGKCGSCFRLCVKEHKKRSLQKVRDNKRQNQRKFKTTMIY